MIFIHVLLNDRPGYDLHSCTVNDRPFMYCLVNNYLQQWEGQADRKFYVLSWGDITFLLALPSLLKLHGYFPCILGTWWCCGASCPRMSVWQQCEREGCLASCVINLTRSPTWLLSAGVWPTEAVSEGKASTRCITYHDKCTVLWLIIPCWPLDYDWLTRCHVEPVNVVLFSDVTGLDESGTLKKFILTLTTAEPAY